MTIYSAGILQPVDLDVADSASKPLFEKYLSEASNNGGRIYTQPKGEDLEKVAFVNGINILTELPSKDISEYKGKLKYYNITPCFIYQEKLSEEITQYLQDNPTIRHTLSYGHIFFSKINTIALKITDASPSTEPDAQPSPEISSNVDFSLQVQVPFNNVKHPSPTLKKLYADRLVILDNIEGSLEDTKNITIKGINDLAISIRENAQIEFEELQENLKRILTKDKKYFDEHIANQLDTSNLTHQTQDELNKYLQTISINSLDSLKSEVLEKFIQTLRTRCCHAIEIKGEIKTDAIEKYYSFYDCNKTDIEKIRYVFPRISQLLLQPQEKFATK